MDVGNRYSENSRVDGEYFEGKRSVNVLYVNIRTLRRSIEEVNAVKRRVCDKYSQMTLGYYQTGEKHSEFLLPAIIKQITDASLRNCSRNRFTYTQIGL